MNSFTVGFFLLITTVSGVSAQTISFSNSGDTTKAAIASPAIQQSTQTEASQASPPQSVAPKAILPATSPTVTSPPPQQKVVTDPAPKKSPDIVGLELESIGWIDVHSVVKNGEEILYKKNNFFSHRQDTVSHNDLLSIKYDNGKLIHLKKASIKAQYIDTSAVPTIDTTIANMPVVKEAPLLVTAVITPDSTKNTLVPTEASKPEPLAKEKTTSTYPSDQYTYPTLWIAANAPFASSGESGIGARIGYAPSAVPVSFYVGTSPLLFIGALPMYEISHLDDSFIIDQWFDDGVKSSWGLTLGATTTILGKYKPEINYSLNHYELEISESGSIRRTSDWYWEVSTGLLYDICAPFGHAVSFAVAYTHLEQNTYQNSAMVSNIDVNDFSVRFAYHYQFIIIE
ncbi:MAG: hypothetical protein OCD76_05080 [Reichenbachiella sp.]